MTVQSADYYEIAQKLANIAYPMVRAHDRLDLHNLTFGVLVQDWPLRVRGPVLVPAFVLALITSGKARGKYIYSHV